MSSSPASASLANCLKAPPSLRYPPRCRLRSAADCFTTIGFPMPNLAKVAKARADDSVDSLLSRRDKLMGTNAPLLYEAPLYLTQGKGVWVFDDKGRRYLDAYNNVPHVGHSHPAVVEAI